MVTTSINCNSLPKIIKKACPIFLTALQNYELAFIVKETYLYAETPAHKPIYIALCLQHSHL